MNYRCGTIRDAGNVNRKVKARRKVLATAPRMAIKKQEFYEGAALHMLARTGSITSVRYESPFFVLNSDVLVLLKYSTRGRSPWGFTFMPVEQILLQANDADYRIVIGLICGSDGVAAFSYESYCSIVAPGKSAIHIACYRAHGEHYEVNGPIGRLPEKVSPSNWQRILNQRGNGNDEAL